MVTYNRADKFSPAKGFTRIVWGERSKILETELAEMQKIILSRMSDLGKLMVTDGFIALSNLTYSSGVLTMQPTTILAGGIVTYIQDKVELSLPVDATVYLAIADVEVAYTDTIRRSGNLNGGVVIADNGILDPDLGIETTRRVQRQIQFVTSTSDPNKIYLPVCQIHFPSDGVTDLRVLSTLATDIPLAKISGVGTAASKNTGTAVGNVPVIGSDGVLDPSVIPAIAITDTFVIGSEAEMLALAVQVGDVAVRTDQRKNYILRATPATVLANWQELLTPTDMVVSVSGKTGAVTLSSGDVGLGNVQNYGTATQAEAEAGVSAAAYMTPERTKQAITALGFSIPYESIPRYGATTGTNTYTATLSPVPTAYVDGMLVAVKIGTTNTGASTLNPNTIGAKALKRSDGSDFPSGKLKAGSIYTFRYNATTGNFIVQGEGGDYNVGDTVTASKLSQQTPDGSPYDAWSIATPTDFSANRIAVDLAGNVYYHMQHKFSSGWRLTKYTPTGSVIWTKTDSDYRNVSRQVRRMHVDRFGQRLFMVQDVDAVTTYPLVCVDATNGNHLWGYINVTSGYYINELAIDTSGNVYCVHTYGSTYLTKMNKLGVPVWQKTISADVPDATKCTGIHVDLDGNVVVSFQGQTNCVLHYDFNGDKLGAIQGIGSCWGVAFDSLNNIYVLTTSQLQKYSSGRAFIKAITAGGFNGSKIRIDYLDNIYATYESNQWRKFDTELNEKSYVGGNQPSNVLPDWAVTRDGSLISCHNFMGSSSLDVRKQNYKYTVMP